MPWNDVSFAEREKLLALYEGKDTNAIRSAAAVLGMEPRSLTRRLQEHRLYKKQYAIQVAFPTLPTRTYDDFPVLTLDDAIIISDLEEPFANPLMKQLAYLMGVRYNIKTLIINGDYVASDQPGISAHSSMTADDLDATYRRVATIAGAQIDNLLTQFNDIHMTNGNHDDMIQRVTHGQIDLGMVLDGKIRKPGFQFTEYAYLIVESSQGPYLVAHPRQYRNNGLALAQAIYSVFATDDGRKAHIILGHTHHTASGKSPDNLRGCHTLGGLRDLRKAAYKNINIASFHQWNLGFGMLLNGRFHNFDLDLTDWKFYLGDLCPAEVYAPGD